MRIVLLGLIFGLCAITNSWSQIQLPEFGYKNVSRYKFVNEIRNENQVIITFRIYGHSGRYGNRQVLILSYSKDWKSYFLKSDYNKTEEVTEVDVDIDQVWLLWEAVVENDILQIRTEDQLHDDPCNESAIIRGGIEDGSWYEFEFITSEDYKVLTYYMPQGFNKFCPMPEREKIAAILPFAGNLYHPLADW